MIVPFLVTAASAIPAYFLYKNFKAKKRKPIKVGDVAYLKSSFFKKYPQIPRNLPVRVEELRSDSAVVVYIQPSINDVVREVVELNALNQPI